MNNSNSRVEYLEPIVTEKRVWNNSYLFIAFIVGVLAIFVQFFAIRYFNLEYTESVFLAFSILIIYAIILFFLLEPRILREIQMTAINTVEKPIVETRYVEKPAVVETKYIDRPVVETRYVEKPAVVETKYIDRPVVETRYVEKSRRALNIPKYAYVGSSEAKVFHSRNCRLGKLIKRKYKVSNNSKSYFLSKKYKPCKVCVKGNKR